MDMRQAFGGLDLWSHVAYGTLMSISKRTGRGGNIVPYHGNCGVE